MNPIILADAYKVGHIIQHHPDTTELYNNTTARKSRIDDIQSVVVFGLQGFIKEYLIKSFNEEFFKQPEDIAVGEFKEIVEHVLGPQEQSIGRIKELWKLGYLPIEIKSLPEGSICPLRVPFHTIKSTHKDFVWVSQYIETLFQSEVWPAITVATLSHHMKNMYLKYVRMTDPENEWFVDYQGHDFSQRGMLGVTGSVLTGAAHLTSFTGTDTLASVKYMVKYYGADLKKDNIGKSVPATEHSVMSAYGPENEIALVKRLITEIYPTGIVSIVADTNNYWRFINEVIPACKEEILARDGKVVIRPDSGVPLNVICGFDVAKTKLTSEQVLSTNGVKLMDIFPETYYCVLTSDNKYITIDKKEISELEVMGSLKIIDKHFGSTKTSTGYMKLNEKIGLIYGDGMSKTRISAILETMVRDKWATTNLVFGHGSYMYQSNTRDTFGIACKATNAVIGGISKPIFKDPCGSTFKQSARGYLRVEKKNDTFVLIENVSPEEEGGELKTVFKDGKLLVEQSINQIRSLLCQQTQ